MYTGFYFLAVGILARMFIPWLVKLYKARNEPAELTWEWHYLRGQVIATAIIFLGLPVLIGDLLAIGGWEFQAAFLAGYGAADLGRLIDKSATE
jgi:hypothetical protein